MNNHYLLLRHGRNVHQTEKKDIVYGWPDDNPPCELDEVGKDQIEKQADVLLGKNVDLIYCSDIFRTKQTAEIVNKKLNKEIIFDERLRDINWGIYAGGLKKDALGIFENPQERFVIRPEGGENWEDLKQRMCGMLDFLENSYSGKNILIVSHGDPLMMLEACMRGWDNDTIIRERESLISVGELRDIWL